ncbi:MAG: CBS domain-containing protein [Kiritimatiellaeota bacterium]|nr:CBS domain-containing protein [Kiritimatiellota bacterium]
MQRHVRLITVQVHTDIREAINLMQIYGISQLPVLDGERVVGSLDEFALLERLTAAELCLWGAVAAFMQPPLPALDEIAFKVYGGHIEYEI